MFALTAILPLLYTVLIAYSGFPLRKQTFDKSALQNDSIVMLLDLNLSDVHEFPYFVPNDQVKNKLANFLALVHFNFLV